MTRHPLARLLAARPWPYARLILMWLAVRVSVLATGLLLQALFNRLSGGGPAGATVWTVLAAVAGVEVFRLFMWYGVLLNRLEPGYTYRIRASLQDSVLTDVLRRPAGTALRRPAGEAISRLGGDADEVGVFAIWSASNLSRMIIAGAAITIMILIDPVVTAGLVVPVILVMGLGMALSGPVGRYRRASREAAGEVSEVLGEAIGGFLTLRAAGADHRVVRRLSELGHRRRRAAVREETFASLQDSLFRATTALGTGGVLLLAAGGLRRGTFSVGDLALFVFYIQFVAEAVSAVGLFLGRVRRARLSLDRLGEMTTRPDDLLRARPTYLDREPPPREDPPGREELRTLTVSGLSCRHPGNGRGVRGVDLDITAGTLTVIAGRVGAGKSTLVRALLGVLPADAGEVRWNGARVDDPAEFLVPPRVGYVPQVPRLFHGSLADAVRMGWDADAAAVREALELAAFGPDLAALPDGLETEVGPGGMALSGGQVKRVAIARVLLRRPALMVIDDLSAGVDVETERALWDGLRGSGAAIVAVGNGPALLRAADQILLVEDGTVAGRGTYDDLEPSIAGFSRAAAGSP